MWIYHYTLGIRYFSLIHGADDGFGNLINSYDYRNYIYACEFMQTYVEYH